MGSYLANNFLNLAIWILGIIGLWKVFVKAGRGGWEAIIPIYNMYVMTKIADKPGWWLLMWFIPFVNIVFIILTYIALARAFGKSGWFAVGLIFLNTIFICILGFGSAQYFGGPTPPRRPSNYTTTPTRM